MAVQPFAGVNLPCRLRAAFSANVSSFDRAWYGLYEVTADALAQFRANFDRIRSC